MRLEAAAYIARLSLGGPGSGCHGPNCGRPEGFHEQLLQRGFKHNTVANGNVTYRLGSQTLIHTPAGLWRHTAGRTVGMGGDFASLDKYAQALPMGKVVAPPPQAAVIPSVVQPEAKESATSARAKDFVTPTAKLDAAEKEALVNYQIISSHLNNALYKGDIHLYLQDIKHLDSALQKSSLNRDVTLYRGLKYMSVSALHGLVPQEWLTITKAQPGQEFSVKGFQSTSADAKRLGDFNAGIALKILAPKGTPAIDMNSRSSVPGQRRREQEVLLPRDLTYRVRSNLGVQDSGPLKGTHVIEVEVHYGKK